MQNFLAENGINVRVKRIDKGSLKHTWRLYNPNLNWSEQLAQKLNNLGFKDFDGKPLGRFSGNGGMLSVFVIYQIS
jgi:hypothetical protein